MAAAITVYKLVPSTSPLYALAVAGGLVPKSWVCLLIAPQWNRPGEWSVLARPMV